MNVVFVSNYFNHHQKPLSDAIAPMVNSYYFICTGEMSDERKKLGYRTIERDYLIYATTSSNGILKATRVIKEADVLIIGSVSNKIISEIIDKSFNNDKCIFRYAERHFKSYKDILKYPKRLINEHKKKHNNDYLLCAGAYTYLDFRRLGLYKDKAFKWGYFPEKYTVDIEKVIQLKKQNSILWCGRLINWKHPEVSLMVAKKLKMAGYIFTLCIIGTGKLEQEMKEKIIELGLEDSVYLLGAMNPEQVRMQMEISEIFLFTSDFNEGWGAVLNESMNSGCAVVASHAIGSAPFLLKDGKNGLIYKNGNIENCYQKVKYLIDHPIERKRLGKNAYDILCDTWNAGVAAERIIKLSRALLVGENHHDLYEDGPCSKARLLRNSWYKA